MPPLVPFRDAVLFSIPSVQKKNGSGRPLKVKQYHFTAWPDHGVPDYATPMLAFYRRVRTQHPKNKGPMVVHCRYTVCACDVHYRHVMCVVMRVTCDMHITCSMHIKCNMHVDCDVNVMHMFACSAGVGRTGTFIAIDHIMEQVEKEKCVDVAGVVTKIRQQRMKMVQTEVSLPAPPPPPPPPPHHISS